MSMSQSSALHRMAAGDSHEPPLDPAMDSTSDPDPFQHIDPPPGSVPGNAPGSDSDRPRSLKRHGPHAADQSLKALAVPLFSLIGLLLLVPAIWGTLVLSGVSVWQSQREDARTMAIAMLVAWPIAVSLLGGAGLFAWQLRGSKGR